MCVLFFKKKLDKYKNIKNIFYIYFYSINYRLKFFVIFVIFVIKIYYKKNLDISNKNIVTNNIKIVINNKNVVIFYFKA